MIDLAYDFLVEVEFVVRTQMCVVVEFANDSIFQNYISCRKIFRDEPILLNLCFTI